MVPAGPGWSKQKSSFSGTAKQSYKDFTANTGGTICPTILIIKSAKDSSSCKLHRYYAVRGNQSTCPRTIFSPNVTLLLEGVRNMVRY